MSKTKSHLVIGVDIGSSTTKVCAVVHFEEKDLHPEIVEIQETYTEGIYKGNIVDEKELANTLHRVINQFKSNVFERRNHIVLALNTSGISSGITNTSIINSSINNEVTRLDLDRLEKEAALSVANIKNKRLIHTIPIKYKIDLAEVQTTPIGMFGKRIDGKFLFVFCPNLYIEKLEQILKGIRLNIEEVVIGPFAESVPLLSKRQRIAGTALVNIGHSTTSILVYENNNPILASVLGIGSNDLTNDIALGLQVSLEEAENIKLGQSDISYSKRKLEEITEARIEFVCERINLELDKISRRELLPGGIVLTGNGSKLPKIDYMFKSYMKLPVKFAEEEIRDFSDGQLGDSAYARAYGLTFLAPIITSDYKVTKLFKNFFKNIKTFLRKLLP